MAKAWVCTFSAISMTLDSHPAQHGPAEGSRSMGRAMEGSEKAQSLDPKLSTWSKSGGKSSLWSMSCSIQKVLRARLKQQPRRDSPFLGSPLGWERPDHYRKQEQVFGEMAEP